MMLYIRQIMEILLVDEFTARKVMNRMNLDFSEATKEAFFNEVWFVWNMMQNNKAPW